MRADKGEEPVLAEGVKGQMGTGSGGSYLGHSSLQKPLCGSRSNRLPVGEKNRRLHSRVEMRRSQGRTQSLEWEREAGGGWWGAADTEAQGGNADKDWEEVVAFEKWVSRQENANCRKMLALNGPHSCGPGVQESSGGRQRRERARPAHRELCGHHALARHSSGNAMWMSA